MREYLKLSAVSAKQKTSLPDDVAKISLPSRISQMRHTFHLHSYPGLTRDSFKLWLHPESVDGFENDAARC